MKIPTIVNTTEFIKDGYGIIERVSLGEAFVITHKTGDSVLLSKESFDNFMEKTEALSDAVAGLQAHAKGEGLTLEELSSLIDQELEQRDENKNTPDGRKLNKPNRRTRSA